MPTPYLLDTVYLNFDLNEDSTAVTSRLHVKPNYNGDPPEMVLDGVTLTQQCIYNRMGPIEKVM